MVGRRPCISVRYRGDRIERTSAPEHRRRAVRLDSCLGCRGLGCSTSETICVCDAPHDETARMTRCTAKFGAPCQHQEAILRDDDNTSYGTIVPSRANSFFASNLRGAKNLGIDPPVRSSRRIATDCVWRTFLMNGRYLVLCAALACSQLRNEVTSPMPSPDRAAASPAFGYSPASTPDHVCSGTSFSCERHFVNSN